MKSTYELAQMIGNKRKNAHKRRFAFNGDPNGSQKIGPNKKLRKLKF